MYLHLTDMMYTLKIKFCCQLVADIGTYCKTSGWLLSAAKTTEYSKWLIFSASLHASYCSLENTGFKGILADTKARSMLDKYFLNISASSMIRRNSDSCLTTSWIPIHFDSSDFWNRKLKIRVYALKSSQKIMQSSKWILNLINTVSLVCCLLFFFL